MSGDDFNIADTCCGRCPGATCYVDYLTGERALRAKGKLNLIRDTLSNAPECDKYDDDDVIVCGWKRDMQHIRAILDGDNDD